VLERYPAETTISASQAPADLPAAMQKFFQKITISMSSLPVKQQIGVHWQ
jgi:hypothetical protein